MNLSQVAKFLLQRNDAELEMYRLQILSWLEVSIALAQHLILVVSLTVHAKLSPKGTLCLEAISSSGLL